MPYIYKITCKTNQTVYIGSSVRKDKKRLHIHKARLRSGTHSNSHLQAAFAKYGEDAFVFEIIEQISNIDELIPAEQRWLDYHKTLGEVFNSGPVVTAPRLGTKLTPEQQKRGKAASEKAGPKISAALKRFYATHAGHRKGKTASAKTRKLISKSVTKFFESHDHPMQGKHFGPEFGERISKLRKEREWWKGKNHTEQSRKKMSDAQKGRIVTPSHREKLARARAVDFPPLINTATGEIYPAGKNIKAFALEHGLDPTHLGNVILGKAKYHKGWMLLSNSGSRPSDDD